VTMSRREQLRKVFKEGKRTDFPSGVGWVQA
jgi:hypothetical protein